MFLSGILPYPVGLDISDLSLKFVQLKKQGHGLGIQAMGKAELSPGIISGGDIVDRKKAVEALKATINRPKFGKIKTDRVVACLPETKTFVKLIEIKRGPNKTEDLIESEIKKHIPLDIKDMYYDWQMISEDNEGRQFVLVGAAPKSIVNQYISFLDEADFSIEALEIEPISICRSLLKEEFFATEIKAKKNYIILDIGASRSSIIFYSHNTILFTISVPLNVDKIKKEPKAGFTDLMKRIQEALDFYSDNFSKRGAIDLVYLCGGGASLDELKSEIERLFSLAVEVGNPLINTKNQSLSQNFTRPKYYLPSFATAIGLALSKVRDY